MAARPSGEGARGAQAHAGNDRPPHSPHARRLRRLSARGRGGGRGHARRRHDLRHRLRAVPRRAHALRALARRRRHPRRARTAGATLRRALPARSGLGSPDMTRRVRDSALAARAVLTMNLDDSATISVRSLSPFGERVGVRGLQNYRETLTLTPPLSLRERERIEPAALLMISIMIAATPSAIAVRPEQDWHDAW